MRDNPSQLVYLFTGVQNLCIFQHPPCVWFTVSSPETNVRICAVETFKCIKIVLRIVVSHLSVKLKKERNSKYILNVSGEKVFRILCSWFKLGSFLRAFIARLSETLISRVTVLKQLNSSQRFAKIPSTGS
jgi:hypothetical protein